MAYRFKGIRIIPSCTPMPMTFNDTRSCRERTGCKRECQPKTLKCDDCGKMESSLCVIEEVETGKEKSVCNTCSKQYMEP